MYTSISGSRRK